MSFTRNSDGSYTDAYGVRFITNSGAPPTSGSPIRIPDGNGGTAHGSYYGSAQKKN